MRDLSMSILDLAMNSIRAHATVIEIKVAETLEWNELELEIKDNVVTGVQGSNLSFFYNEE